MIVEKAVPRLSDHWDCFPTLRNYIGHTTLQSMTLRSGPMQRYWFGTVEALCFRGVVVNDRLVHTSHCHVLQIGNIYKILR